MIMVTGETMWIKLIAYEKSGIKVSSDYIHA